MLVYFTLFCPVNKILVVVMEINNFNLNGIWTWPGAYDVLPYSTNFIQKLFNALIFGASRV